MTDYKALAGPPRDDPDWSRAMSEDYPAPPPELVQQWRAAASNVPASLSTDPGGRRDYIDFIATKAARWGADTEAVNWAAYFARQAAAQEKEPLSPLSLIKSHKLISDATSRARQAAEEIEGRGEPTVMEIIELADEIEAAELGQVDLVRAALARWGNG
jgi:hypothetical protein